ncbi:hypothetical protein E5288_WYG012270 [Bos mutus]|uniref:Uncharacterized protein n=1 Tax=Bos mutus TaxID=72004 RepID=A0A6B0RLK1_9CETA|nr:hypothetical protein [Bos mutus]
MRLRADGEVCPSSRASRSPDSEQMARHSRVRPRGVAGSVGTHIEDVIAAPLWCRAVWSTADDHTCESSQKAEEEWFLPCDAHGPGSRQPVADLGTEGLTGPEERGPGPPRGFRVLQSDPSSQQTPRFQKSNYEDYRGYRILINVLSVSLKGPTTPAMDGPNQGPDPGVLYFGGKERKELG